MLMRAAEILQMRATQMWPGKSIKSRLDRPIASITFDDFAKSAWTEGGRIVEAAGARATYFAAGSFCGREVDGIRYFDSEDLITAHANGHEIACHTFTHRTVARLSDGDIKADLERNQAFVRDLLGDVVLTSFAFPHGKASIRSKRRLAAHYAACRGIFPGINKGRIDLSQLKAVELIPYILNRHPLDRLIEEAASSSGWLILLTHDVSDRPSPWGCTPQMLETALGKLQAAGIEILPVKNALGRVAFARQ